MTTIAAIGYTNSLRVSPEQPTTVIGSTQVGPPTIYPSPTYRVTAVVSSTSVTFWSGDPSRNLVVGQWPYDTSPILSKRRSIVGPSRPLCFTWRGDETAVSLLFSHGILIVLTLESKAEGGVDESQVLPTWANVGGTSGAHSTLSMAPSTV